MRRIVLTFGLIAGGILAAMLALSMLFEQSISFDTGAIIGYTTMVLAFLLIYFGVRTYRDTVAGGTIGFGRAMQVGMLIAAVASVCYVITWEVIYFRNKAAYAAKYEAHLVEKAQQTGATAVQLEAVRAKVAKDMVMYNNPAFNVAITFLEPLPTALIIALVSAGVLSRKRRSASPAPSHSSPTTV
jgi:CBS domain containing-hemolysin-like protein